MKVAIKKRLAKRLAKLALFIYNDNKVKFDIKNYMSDDWGTCLPSGYKCATACCSLGYAAILFPKYRKFQWWDDVFYALIGEKNEFYGSNHHPIYRCLFHADLPDGRQAAVARIWLYLETGVASNDEDAIKMYQNVEFNKSMLNDLQSVLEK